MPLLHICHLGAVEVGNRNPLSLGTNFGQLYDIKLFFLFILIKVAAKW